MQEFEAQFDPPRTYAPHRDIYPEVLEHVERLRDKGYSEDRIRKIVRLIYPIAHD